MQRTTRAGGRWRAVALALTITMAALVPPTGEVVAELKGAAAPNAPYEAPSPSKIAAPEAPATPTPVQRDVTPKGQEPEGGSGSAGGGWGDSVFPPPWLADLAVTLVMVLALRFSFRLGRREPADHGTDQALAAHAPGDRPLEPGDLDVLALNPLAARLSRFLRHEKTDLPLTIAINGGWGSGKSSLMRLLAAELEGYGWRSVWYNPWHRQKDAYQLAALIEEVRRQAVPPFLSVAGLWVRCKLLGDRLAGLWRLPAALGTLWLACIVAAGLSPTLRRWLDAVDPRRLDEASWGRATSNLYEALKVVTPDWAVTLIDRLLAVLAAVLPWLPLGAEGQDGAFVAAPLTLLLMLLGFFVLRWLISARLPNPGRLLALVMGDSGAGPGEAQLAYRHRFADQFARLTRALSRPRAFATPLVVFVDDLDRCRAPAVLEMLEAINFLVSSGRCVVVLGIARPQVEATLGLALGPEADALAAGSHLDASKDDLELAARAERVAYARAYLAKLIQLEVAIPTLEADAAERLLTATDAVAAGRWTAAGRWLRRHGLAMAALALLAGLALTLWLPVEQLPTVAGSGAAVSAQPSSTLRWIAASLGGGGAAGLAFALGRRARGGVVRDSARFLRMLRDCEPLITAGAPTPRTVKRFLNRLRWLSTGLAVVPAADLSETELVFLAACQPLQPGLPSGPDAPGPVGQLIRETLVATSWSLGSPFRPEALRAFHRLAGMDALARTGAPADPRA